MNPQSWQRALRLTEPDMVKSMCLELSQADLKAIGRSREFEPDIIASRELLQHSYLTEQGVASAMAALTPVEIAGLHLLHGLRGEVDVEFFARIYPAAVSVNRYGSYHERFKNLFLEVKTHLIQRGLLLMGNVADFRERGATVLERRRFRLPEAFGALLPAPFQARQLDPAKTGKYRSEIVRHKLAELLRLGSASSGKGADSKADDWRLIKGRLMLGSGDGSFQVKQIEAWQRAQFEAVVGYINKQQPEALRPVPLFLYALSRLREHEWLAPPELEVFWKLALSGAKAPEPQAVGDAGYECGCVEKLEWDGSPWYRPPRFLDAEAGAPFEGFLQTDHPRHVGIRLEHLPLAALERLAEVSRLELAEGGLRATPDLIQLSHARAETLADPMVCWLREHHPAFRDTLEKIEQRRGKLIVHENLLVARIRDLGLKAMLEKKFGAPGQLVTLAGEYVALPRGLLPEVQSWMKKSGHVIKSVQSGDPEAADEKAGDDE